MKRWTLTSADHLISVADIAGTSPRGCSTGVRTKLFEAIDSSPNPRFSFAGVQTIGDEFITRCLAPTLFKAAQAGKPVLATEVDRNVAQQLHLRLHSIGALLFQGETGMALGATPQLVNALSQVRRGRQSPAKLAAFLGITELAAANQLGLLSHWGLPIPKSPVRKADLPLAA